ncbi:glutaredoxin-C9-like [Vigna unguiculata]|nr:glutaredoxin-C9-like [Vigna unguiculata]
MHQAIPFRSWRPLHNPLPLITHSHNDPSSSPKQEPMLLNMVWENAVTVVGRRGCCMSHVVNRLLLGLGVNPAVYEVEENDEAAVATQLEATVRREGVEPQGNLQFPAVFIGGKLFGGLDRIMATHISGELVPILKQAGALWL